MPLLERFEHRPVVGGAGEDLGVLGGEEVDQFEEFGVRELDFFVEGLVFGGAFGGFSGIGVEWKPAPGEGLNLEPQWWTNLHFNNKFIGNLD